MWLVSRLGSNVARSALSKSSLRQKYLNKFQFNWLMCSYSKCKVGVSFWNSKFTLVNVGSMKFKKFKYRKTDGSLISFTMNSTDLSLSSDSICMKYNFSASHCSSTLSTAWCNDGHRVWHACSILCGYNSRKSWACLNWWFSFGTVGEVGVNISNQVLTMAWEGFNCLWCTQVNTMTNTFRYSDSWKSIP